MSDIERARRLLDQLRRRTEARGATPAEAAQAAELADRIMQRYQLDEISGDDVDVAIELEGKRFAAWATVIAMALRERFGVHVWQRTKRGSRAAIVFRGPEHRCSVAQWLGSVIIADIADQSDHEARTLGCKGSRLVRFRNRFRLGAALEIYRRLNPSTPIVQDDNEDDSEAIDHTPNNREPRELTKTEQQDMLAGMAGQRFASEICLDDNALGTDHLQPKIDRGSQ